MQPVSMALSLYFVVISCNVKNSVFRSLQQAKGLINDVHFCSVACQSGMGNSFCQRSSYRTSRCRVRPA